MSETSKVTPSTTADGAPPRKPFNRRPPRTTEERLPKLYRALTDQVDDGYYQNAIKTSKKILALDPSSEAAFQTLLFLNLQTDNYTAALDLLSKPPSTNASLGFERAYCLYRLHREKEALEVLEGLSEKGAKVEHLEAQIRYRLGEYQKAQDIYDDLLAACDPTSPEHPDILNNLSATASHIDFTTHSYRSHLSSNAGSTSQHIPSEADLESYVPSLPTGWSSGGLAATVEKKTAAVKAPTEKKTRTKPKHKLPKGAVAGKTFAEDPDRWLPLRQRASYAVAQSKKKGAKESMGTGFTQGSTASGRDTPSGGGGGGGGGKSKKGKRK